MYLFIFVSIYWNVLSFSSLENYLERIPSGFSDATTDDDDVDLSKMTEEEKEEYFKNKEERRKQREARRRAKYGDKYDEIMKKKQE